MTIEIRASEAGVKNNVFVLVDGENKSLPIVLSEVRLVMYLLGSKEGELGDPLEVKAFENGKGGVLGGLTVNAGDNGVAGDIEYVGR